VKPRPPSSFRNRRASVLIVALLLCAAIGISLVSYYRLAGSALTGASRSLLSFSSVNVAEMGIERAMACFYQVSNGVAPPTAWDSSVWTLNSSTAEAKAIFPSGDTYFDIAPGTRAQVKVYVRHYAGTGGAPLIVAKSIITPTNSPPLIKFIEITLANRSLWGFGMVGRTSVKMNSNSRADSWISDSDANPATNGVAYPGAGRRDNGSVGTVNTANGSLAMNSNAEIYGTANTGGGTVTTSGNVRIQSATSPANPKVDPSRVHRDFKFTFPAITVPTGSVINDVTANLVGGTAGSPQVLPRATDYRAADGKYYLKFKPGKVINIDSNKYISVTEPLVLIFADHPTDITIHTSSNANINVTPGKTLEIYTNGGISLDSNNNLNVGNDASKLSIYGTNPTAQTFILSSNVNIYGTIYAPTATFSIDSNCHLYGAMIANTIQMDSNASFHYDESLATTGTGSGFRVSRWKELQSTAERSNYDGNFNF